MRSLWFAGIFSMFLSLGGNMALAEKAFKGEENQVKEVKQQEAVLSAFKEKFLQAR